MEDLTVTLSVIVMFLVRIGIPVLVLIVLGVVIERWQTQREEYVRRYYDHDDRQPQA